MVQDAMKTAQNIDLLDESRFKSIDKPVFADDHASVSLLLTMAENNVIPSFSEKVELARSRPVDDECPVVITGTGRAGKSSLMDEVMLRIRRDNPEARVALLATDPTRKKTGGALLGDRIRMNSLTDSGLYMRSFASRGSGREIADCIGRAIQACKAVGFDLILVETSGIGQGNDAITEVADASLYVTTREYGAPSQLEKLAALDFADIVVLNKFDRPGAEDALAEIRKQFQRNREAFDSSPEEMPVVPTIASQFADAGVDRLWEMLAELLNSDFQCDFSSSAPVMGRDGLPARELDTPESRDTAEVAAAVRSYHQETEETAKLVSSVQRLESAANLMSAKGKKDVSQDIAEQIEELRDKIPNSVWESIEDFDSRAKAYRSGQASYTIGVMRFQSRQLTKQCQAL